MSPEQPVSLGENAPDYLVITTQVLKVSGTNVPVEVLQPPAGFVSTDFYALCYGLSPITVRSQCRHGRLAGAIKRGKSWYVPEALTDEAFQ